MDEKNIVNRGIKLLTDVDEKQYFSVINGVVLKNIRELASLLETIHIDHFGYHVNEHKNDFYNWIKYSIGDEELAERIKNANSPDVMKLIILERIKELEDSLEEYEHKQTSISDDSSGKSYEEEIDSFKEEEKDREENVSEIEDDLDSFFEEKEEKKKEIIEVEKESKDSYSHEEILEEIEKALNETDSVLGLKHEDKESNVENKILEEHKSFSWIDFILGFVFGFIIGLLLVIAYYKMYVLV